MRSFRFIIHLESLSFMDSHTDPCLCSCVLCSLLFVRTRPDAPRLDSDNPLSSSPAERPAPLKAKRSHRKADPDAAHRYTSTHTCTYTYTVCDQKSNCRTPPRPALSHEKMAPGQVCLRSRATSSEIIFWRDNFGLFELQWKLEMET